MSNKNAPSLYSANPLIYVTINLNKEVNMLGPGFFTSCRIYQSSEKTCVKIAYIHTEFDPGKFDMMSTKYRPLCEAAFDDETYDKVQEDISFSETLQGNWNYYWTVTKTKGYGINLRCDKGQTYPHNKIRKKIKKFFTPDEKELQLLFSINHFGLDYFFSPNQVRLTYQRLKSKDPNFLNHFSLASILDQMFVKKEDLFFGRMPICCSNEWKHYTRKINAIKNRHKPGTLNYTIQNIFLKKPRIWDTSNNKDYYTVEKDTLSEKTIIPNCSKALAIDCLGMLFSFLLISSSFIKFNLKPNYYNPIVHTISVIAGIFLFIVFFRAFIEDRRIQVRVEPKLDQNLLATAEEINLPPEEIVVGGNRITPT